MNKIGKVFLICGVLLNIVSISVISIAIKNTLKKRKEEQQALEEYIIPGYVYPKNDLNNYFEWKFDVSFKNDEKKEAKININLGFNSEKDGSINRLLTQKKDVIELYFIYDSWSYYSHYHLRDGSELKIKYCFFDGINTFNNELHYDVGLEAEIPHNYHSNSKEGFISIANYLEQENIDMAKQSYVYIPYNTIYSIYISKLNANISKCAIEFEFEVLVKEDRFYDSFDKDIISIDDFCSNNCYIGIQEH